MREEGVDRQRLANVDFKVADFLEIIDICQDTFIINQVAWQLSVAALVTDYS